MLSGTVMLMSVLMAHTIVMLMPSVPTLMAVSLVLAILDMRAMVLHAHLSIMILMVMVFLMI